MLIVHWAKSTPSGWSSWPPTGKRIAKNLQNELVNEITIWHIYE